jgi:hypothetical protein
VKSLVAYNRRQKTRVNKHFAGDKCKRNDNGINDNNDNISSKNNIAKTSDKTDWSRQNSLDLYFEWACFETEQG